MTKRPPRTMVCPRCGRMLPRSRRLVRETPRAVYAFAYRCVDHGWFGAGLGPDPLELPAGVAVPNRRMRRERPVELAASQEPRPGKQAGLSARQSRALAEAVAA